MLLLSPWLFSEGPETLSGPYGAHGGSSTHCCNTSPEEITFVLVSFIPKTGIESWLFEWEANTVVKDMNIQVFHQQVALNDPP